MSNINSIAAWLEEFPLSQRIAESEWLFPSIETVHVLSIAIVFGSILMIDMRLIGRVKTDRAISGLVSDVLPWTWIAFAVAAISGGLMFCSRAADYIENWAFLVKSCLIVVAGLNMLAFHLLTYRTYQAWDEARSPPALVRAAGLISMVTWVGVIFMGRWIGFVL